MFFIEANGPQEKTLDSINVYAVFEDFGPAAPGTDSMDELQHWHIDDGALEPTRAEAFDEELAQIARAA